MFSTTKTTLQNEPDSMLANMFSGELVPGIQDEQGAYMLDRTPKYFEPILNYLRTKELVIDPNVSMDGVLGEARYFGIQSIVDQIEKLKLAEEQKKIWCFIRYRLQYISRMLEEISEKFDR